MSSVFDNIDEPSDQPFKKPRYVQEREKALRWGIFLVIGLSLMMGISAAIYEAFAEDFDLDCLWRVVGGLLGGILGATFGIVRVTLRSIQTAITDDIMGNRRDSDVQFDGLFYVLVFGGAMFGAIVGITLAGLILAGEKFREELGPIISALAGGAAFLIAAAVMKHRDSRREVPQADQLD